MKRATLLALAAVLLAVAPSAPVRAHCQMPCGIYDDAMRIRMMQEDVTTIEKSIGMIEELSAKAEKSAVDQNQLVRWVINKDHIADDLTGVVVEYFLQQRVKAPTSDDAAAMAKYVDQLKVLHELLVTSMKAKQTVDREIPGKLRDAIDRFAKLYFSKEDLEHLKEHD
jgi:nickel superoxide dismutase